MLWWCWGHCWCWWQGPLIGRGPAPAQNEALLICLPQELICFSANCRWRHLWQLHWWCTHHAASSGFAKRWTPVASEISIDVGVAWHEGPCRLFHLKVWGKFTTNTGPNQPVLPNRRPMSWSLRRPCVPAMFPTSVVCFFYFLSSASTNF